MSHAPCHCITPHYENDEIPDIDEIQCPIETGPECLHWFDRNALATHIGEFHFDYRDDPEPYFEAERQRRNQ